MKTQLFAAAAVAAVLAAPALAHAQDGYVDAAYRGLDAGAGASVDGFSIGAGYKADLGAAKLQLNGNYANLDAGGSDDGVDLGAHLYAQNEKWSAGGFVTYTDVSLADAWGVGAEGSLYFNQVTLGATISYNEIGSGGGGGHFTGFGLSAKAFATDNLSFAATWDKIDASGGDGDAIGAEVEWKTTGPVSLFASYGNFDIAGTDYDKYSAGIRFNFGGKSLKEQERSGAKAQRSLSPLARSLF